MKFLLSLFFLFTSLNLFANADIEILNPKIRLTPPGGTITAMFVNIVNHTDTDLKLIKVAGEFAKNFELHNMEMIDGKMKMRSVDFILLKKNSTTELKSGGLHIMIFDLKNPLKAGETHHLKLTLDNKKEIEVKAIVEKIN